MSHSNAPSQLLAYLLDQGTRDLSIAAGRTSLPRTPPKSRTFVMKRRRQSKIVDTRGQYRVDDEQTQFWAISPATSKNREDNYTDVMPAHVVIGGEEQSKRSK